jgi:DNA-binding response OmpR family regulator
MPQMDGVTLAQMLTLVRPDMNILLMSAYTGASFKVMRDNFLRASFLQKPFGLPELLERVLELTAPPPMLDAAPGSATLGNMQ